MISPTTAVLVTYCTAAAAIAARTSDASPFKQNFTLSHSLGVAAAAAAAA